MNVQKDRSYAKESTKTTPSGVRFDKEKLEFIQKKEPKLTTKQKVVDFLLNKFWWESKVSKPNHKGLPPDELNDMPNYQPATPASYDSKKMDKITHDEPAMWAEPKIGQYEAYQKEISEAGSIGEVENISREIKKDTIPDWQKKKLEQMAVSKSQTFEF